MRWSQIPGKPIDERHSFGYLLATAAQPALALDLALAHLVNELWGTGWAQEGRRDKWTDGRETLHLR